jgi:hypothetical protein
MHGEYDADLADRAYTSWYILLQTTIRIVLYLFLDDIVRHIKISESKLPHNGVS